MIFLQHADLHVFYKLQCLDPSALSVCEKKEYIQHSDSSSMHVL